MDDVRSVLKTLNVNKACAPGDASPIILKKCCDVLYPSLCVLFNVCLSLGVLPLEWKKTNVIPIFKNKGDKSHVKNYRPISLLTTVSKVLERCIFNRIYPSLANKIHPLQHGFVKGRSCATQLLKVYHEIGAILDRGGQVDIVFLDFSKAFDCVSHKLLLYKLQFYFGITGNLLKWFESYLSSRTQRCMIENEFSEWTNVTSGVHRDLF